MQALGLDLGANPKKIIKQGRVRLNDAQAKLGDKVGELDKVYVDGNLIESIAQPTRIIMLNKQRGVICSKNHKNLVQQYLIIYLIHRLIGFQSADLMSTQPAYLLITNNGELAHKLMHPSSIIDREYLVRARGTLVRKSKNPC